MSISNRMTIALGDLMNALNIMGSDRDKDQAVREVFRYTHRTIKQQFVKTIILPVLRQLAEDYANGYYDARNEASASLASKMLKNVTEEDLYLPFH